MQQDMKKFVAALSDQERARLFALLQNSSGLHFTLLNRAELIRAEVWFTKRMEQTDSGPYLNARIRIWLIFVLLRHGGLRLREIMSLSGEDCQFSSGKIKVSGREALFAPDIARRIGKVWHSWAGNSKTFPLKCDDSQIRRTMARCAYECHIRTECLNASNLRKARGHELESAGLDPRIVAWYMGKTKNPAPYGLELASYLIENQIIIGGKMKTSARNLFQGQIVSINETGILVDVIVETDSGLKVSAIITKTSKDSMQLAPGKVVYAMVKAPWVSVLPVDERAKAAEVNCYEGKVESVKQDAMACEILVTLNQGNRICSLYANGASPSANIAKDATVVVTFSPFSVILTEN